MIYLIKELKLDFISLFFIFFYYEANSLENKIIFKINNEIITSYDIKRELNYLALINPKILNLKKSQIFKVSNDSIIRERIKIEIMRHIENIELDNDYLKKLRKTILN